MRKWLQKIKVEQWWDSKVAPAMAILYWLWSRVDSHLPLACCLAQLGLFLAGYIGLAGVGHLLNDYFDQDQDSRCGLRNFFHSAGRLEKCAVPTIFLCAALLPWMYSSKECGAFAVLEIALLWLYSAPPLRVKERGRWAHLFDGMYGYALPLSLPWFWLGARAGAGWAWLVVWATVMGIGQNLLHQILDFENDQKSGTRTFAVASGWRRCWRELIYFWTPLEVLLLVALLARFSGWALAGLTLYALLAGLRHWRECLKWREDLARFVQLDVLNWFVAGWLPLLALAGLLWRQPQLWPLLPFHYFAFANGARAWIRFGRW